MKIFQCILRSIIYIYSVRNIAWLPLPGTDRQVSNMSASELSQLAGYDAAAEDGLVDTLAQEFGVSSEHAASNEGALPPSASRIPVLSREDFRDAFM